MFFPKVSVVHTCTPIYYWFFLNRCQISSILPTAYQMAKKSDPSYFAVTEDTLITIFTGPTWGPSGADRTQVGPMLAPWTLLSRTTKLTLINCAATDPPSFQKLFHEIPDDKRGFWYSYLNDDLYGVYLSTKRYIECIIPGIHRCIDLVHIINSHFLWYVHTHI